MQRMHVFHRRLMKNMNVIHINGNLAFLIFQKTVEPPSFIQM